MVHENLDESESLLLNNASSSTELVSQDEDASIEQEDVENSEDEDEEEDDDESRYWSALSFIFILLVLGIPLWWKLTEIERSFFPYNRIDAINDAEIKIHSLLFVYSSNSTTAQELTSNLQILFGTSHIYNILVASLFDKKFESTDEKYISKKIKDELPSGAVVLIELPQTEDSQLIIGNSRVIYFPQNMEATQLYELLQYVIYQEEELIESIKAAVSPSSATDNADRLRRVRPSIKYDIVFTTVNPEPANISFTWNQEKASEEYTKSVIQQLRPLSKFIVKSHWLYLININQKPTEYTYNNRKYYGLKQKQITHMITPLESKLGSGISENPCINFVLYISKTTESPLYFISDENQISRSSISARWGGIQLISPSVNSRINDKEIMDVFVSQFLALVGIRDFSKILKREKSPNILNELELDYLFRLRIIEFYISAKLTLSSLSQLLQEIGNIVITEEVGKSVMTSIACLEDTLKYLKNNNLEKALQSSKWAFESAEYAFSHPSLLSLLYFPDDQKYAVYIPLFLPIMIPVLLSFYPLYQWIDMKLNKHL